MELVSPPFANNVVIEISREAITWQSLCSKETHLKQRWHTHIQRFDPRTGASKSKKRSGGEIRPERQL